MVGRSFLGNVLAYNTNTSLQLLDALLGRGRSIGDPTGSILWPAVNRTLVLFKAVTNATGDCKRK